jgi:hypothetical protein
MRIDKNSSYFTILGKKITKTSYTIFSCFIQEQYNSKRLILNSSKYVPYYLVLMRVFIYLIKYTQGFNNFIYGVSNANKNSYA